MPNNLKKRAEDIQKKVGKVIANATGIPVKIIDARTVEGMMDIIKKCPKITKNISKEELRQEVSGFISGLYGIPPKDDKELKKRANEFMENLSKSKEYKAILIFDSIYNLPIGKRFGNLEIIKKDLSYQGIKKYIDDLEKNKKFKLKDCSWARLRFKSYRPMRFWEDFIKELERPLSIISFITREDIDTKDILGMIYLNNKPRVPLSKREHFHGWSIYNKKFFENYINTISKIYTKKNPSEVEKKFIQAIEIFWLSNTSHKIEINFLLTISALESLIMSEKDRGKIKLAEKISFLLSEDNKKRYEIYKEIIKLYKKRSSLIHKGERKIERDDLNKIKNIFFNLALKIVELSKTYKTSGEIGNYVERLKFGLR